jgi:D-alanyl-D-alanine carboxypeptidase
MEKILIEIHEKLGINQLHLESTKLKLNPQPELHMLEVVDIDFEGKPFILLSSTAKAWRAMVEDAKRDQITLKPFSGFRSYTHQMGLIQRRLNEGRELTKVLTHIAIPGFSEHHTGRAIDIHAEGHPILEEEFELTPEFQWLSKNAGKYQFRLSYPRDNDQGIIFEPWHWFYVGN